MLKKSLLVMSLVVSVVSFGMNNKPNNNPKEFTYNIYINENGVKKTIHVDQNTPQQPSKPNGGWGNPEYYNNPSYGKPTEPYYGKDNQNDCVIF
jgi:hypothetical protein